MIPKLITSWLIVIVINVVFIYCYRIVGILTLHFNRNVVVINKVNSHTSKTVELLKESHKVRTNEANTITDPKHMFLSGFECDSHNQGGFFVV